MPSDPSPDFKKGHGVLLKNYYDSRFVVLDLKILNLF
jgi:hypothetical protein